LSGLAKFFIGLMAFLSLALAVAVASLFAQRTNWFDKYNEQLTLVTDAKKQATDAERAKDEAVAAIQKKLDDSVAQNMIIEGQRDEYKAKWKDQETEFNKLDNKLERLATTIQEQSDNITDLRENNMRIEKELARIKDERDQAIAERVEAIQDAVILEKLIEKKGAQLEEGQRLLVEARNRIDELTGQQTGETLLPPVRISGIVSYIEVPFIGLSIGLDDKVKRGDVFTVYNGATFVSRVKVVRVERDVSVAKELTEWRYDDTRGVQEGDRVSNAI